MTIESTIAGHLNIFLTTMLSPNVRSYDKRVYHCWSSLILIINWQHVICLTKKLLHYYERWNLSENLMYKVACHHLLFLLLFYDCIQSNNTTLLICVLQNKR